MPSTFAHFSRRPVSRNSNLAICANPRSHRGVVQPKLRIGAVNDPAEREADRVADRVMRMPAPAGNSNSAAVRQILHGQTINRMCEDCAEEELQLKRSDKAASASPQMDSQTSSAEGAALGVRGNGNPLPSSERAFFEPRLGFDLSGVRIHTSQAADAASRTINARAFTLGSDIAFARGEYAPGSRSGRHLLAHELVHVKQQGASSTIRRDECDRQDYSARAEPSIEMEDTQTLLDRLELLGDLMDGGMITTLDQYCAIRDLSNELEKRKALPEKWKKVIRPSKAGGWNYVESSGRWEKGYKKFRTDDMTAKQRARGDKPSSSGTPKTEFERGCVGVTNAMAGFPSENLTTSDCYAQESDALKQAKAKVCKKEERPIVYGVRYWDSKRDTRKVGKDKKYPTDMSELYTAKPGYTNYDFGYRQADGSYVHADHTIPGMKVKISPTKNQFDNNYAGFNTVLYCVRCGTVS